MTHAGGVGSVVCEWELVVDEAGGLLLIQGLVFSEKESACGRGVYLPVPMSKRGAPPFEARSWAEMARLGE